VRGNTTAMAAPFWVLASEAPAALARFYSQLLNVPVEIKGSVQQLTLSQGQQLVIYQPSSQRPQPAQHGRLALCLPSANLESSLEQALAQGARALEAIRQESFGREVWIEDPEGNRLLLLEWAQ
jgi:predicted enzyme related to lactoylglutathione lyase